MREARKNSEGLTLADYRAYNSREEAHAAWWRDNQCDNCGHFHTVYMDPEGLWIECACDAGYVS